MDLFYTTNLCLCYCRDTGRRASPLINKGRAFAKIQSIIINAIRDVYIKINFSRIGLIHLTLNTKSYNTTVYNTCSQCRESSQKSLKPCGFHATHTDGRTKHDL